MLFRLKQLLGRIWWIGIRGDSEKRSAFWYNLIHRKQIKRMEKPVFTADDSIIKEQLQKMAQLMRDIPLVSIVIVTYNNLELNRNCVYSILKETKELSYEVIIVDNCSTDGTVEWLQLFKECSFIKTILNKENKGFAAANNQGMRMAQGQYIVLLNNDTMVTSGWLQSLYNHFQSNPRLGMCGPVTNSIGNEARIYTEHLEQYLAEHIGKSYYNIQALAFFCVIISKKVILECGYLDEAYGTGMFEDDDYAQAVRHAGYELAIAEDAFVWHFESASFGKLSSNVFQKLFQRNRKYYETKWETRWKPHSLRKQRIEE